ncbi:hypothetical protein DPMN_079227 [Dreissena polymorpha]|uniref:Uncharacterized protein n=1 Tax=Dreissena polymorpha TaxID=45954 RepID=A0A9D3YTE1_DREPO|nr:hypothetical protein DPMN_079227 [Dreissena polymorpha]
MLKRVVCKLSGVTIYCQYEGAECIIDYRPSGAANVQGIYAVFADIIHPDVEESIRTDSRVVNMKKNEDDDEENEDEEEEDKDDDDEDSNDDNYDEEEEEEELSDADDDSLDDPFEKEIRERFEKWKVEVCSKEQEKEVLKMTTVQCGVCLAEFTGQSPFDKLKDHYYDKLTHKDFKHFKAGCHWLQQSTECVVCGRHFGHCCSLMQHMFDKSRRVDVEGDQHRMMVMKGIVEPICYHDVVHKDLKKLQEEIGNTLLQDTHEQDFQEMLGFAMMASRAMRCPNLFGDSDSDDYFDSDEYELLCQGIKPWDPEAGAALAVLNGW